MTNKSQIPIPNDQNTGVAFIISVILTFPVWNVLSSRSYTGLEFGILVIVICLIFGISDLVEWFTG